MADFEEPKETLLSLFQVDLSNMDSTELGLMYHLQSLTPSEIDKLPYFRYENLIKNLNELLKKKQEAEKKANDGSSQTAQTYTNPSKQAESFLNKAKGNMPSMSNIKLPKI